MRGVPPVGSRRSRMPSLALGVAAVLAAAGGCGERETNTLIGLLVSAPLFMTSGAPVFPGTSDLKLNSAGAPVVVTPDVTVTKLDPATLKPAEPPAAGTAAP